MHINYRIKDQEQCSAKINLEAAYKVVKIAHITYNYPIFFIGKRVAEKLN